MESLPDPPPEIRVGVSSCLLGEEVRFDGGHCRDGFLTGTLARWFRFVPVCPEMEAGMGSPRETLRLVGSPASPRLVAPASGTDWTEAMRAAVTARLAGLEAESLHGFILKKNSPSCGMERVRIYGDGGMPQKNGVGLFAAALMERFPLLPVEEDGRLHDPGLRENFLERVFAYHRWRRFVMARPRRRDLVRFHTIHKLTLMSHHRPDYERLGRLVAGAGKAEWKPLLADYGDGFMQALRHRATRRKHANVLYHLMGYLKRDLDGDDRAEMAETIENYRLGLLPLIVPVTLLRHHLRRHPDPWPLEQTYLSPYPHELMLRNHV